jgi:hypothetical protein
MKLIASGILLVLALLSPPQAKIGLSTTSITISAPDVGPVPTPSTLTVQNIGDAKLYWTATLTPSNSWLTVTPQSGTLNKNGSIDLSVSVVLTGLIAKDYVGTIQISDPNASNNPQTCTVTLHVSASPQIGLSPTSFSFTGPDGGPNPGTQTLTVKNTGGGSLVWTGSSDVPWLSGAPAGGTLSAGASEPVTLSVNTAGQGATTLTGHWTVTSTGVSNSPQIATVTLTISPVPVIGVSPVSLTFDTPQGSDPSPLPLTVSNEGSGSLVWSVTSDTPSWLGTTPAGGTLASGTNQVIMVSITAKTAGLAEGTYVSALRFTGTGASNAPVVPVTLNVNTQPKIGTNPKSLSFTVSVDHTNSSPAAISITNTGSGTLSWGTSCDAGWLGISPPAGSLGPLGSEPMLLSAAGAGLTPGHYTTTVSVSDPNASNSPQTISIDLTVADSSLPTDAPAGQCGLVGPEALALGLLAASVRRLRRKGGSSP